MPENVKEILHKQMELLAEASKRDGVSTIELCAFSMAMAAIAREAKELNHFKPFSFEPDQYELQRAPCKLEQEH